MIDRYALKETLENGVVTVTFTKADGSLREMHCTLNRSIMPPQLLQEEVRTPRKENPDVISVWDVDMNGWRSFRFDSIQSVA